MKISRKKVAEFVDSLNDPEGCAVDTVKDMIGHLKLLDIEVEPESILPDITQGNITLQNDGKSVTLRSDAGGRLIYRMEYNCIAGEREAMANGKLHAAAPDMAKVIKRAYDHFATLNPDESAPLLDDFRNVLRKAGANI